MALKLNERIKTISNSLSDTAGVELRSYASQITSTLTSVTSKITSSNNDLLSSWKDSVGTKVSNMMQTISTTIKSANVKASTLNNASILVTRLKNACDAYVKAYNEYKSSDYYKSAPTGYNKNNSSWYTKKSSMENSLKAKEEAALNAEEEVKKAFGVKITEKDKEKEEEETEESFEVTVLSGAELTNFCNKHYVNKNNVIVKKTKVKINGVTFDLYYVYDRSKGSNNTSFEKYVKDSLDMLKRVDKEVLQLVKSTDLIYEQSYNCDVGHRKFMPNGGRAQAWYISTNNAITSWYSSTNQEYAKGTIIHELGHAVDNALGKAQTGSTAAYETKTVNKSKWRQLILSESDSLKKSGQITGLCPSYGKQTYLSSQTEYLAETFYAYYSSDRNKNALKRYCPNTYREIENVIQKAKNYSGGVRS